MEPGKGRNLQLMDRNLDKSAVTQLAVCSECGARAGLHALSCSRYGKGSEPATRLTDAELAELRALTPFVWEAWPPNEYDQGLPVVEVRQDQLRELLNEVKERRRLDS